MKSVFVPAVQFIKADIKFTPKEALPLKPIVI